MEMHQLWQQLSSKLCKKRNFKTVSDNSIICCEKSHENNGSTTDVEFFDAIERVCDKEKKIELGIFTYIIKQKDMIIKELNDKIQILNEHINSLTISKQNNCDNSFNRINNLTSDHRNSGMRGPTTKIRKDPPTKTKKDSPSSSDKCNVNQKPILQSDVAYAVKQAEHQLVLDSIINVSKDDWKVTEIQPKKDGIDSKSQVILESCTNLVKDNPKALENLPKQRNNSRRNVIIGTDRNTSLEAVPKFVSLHVYRLKPEITVSELTELLKPHFPEVKCETLQSRHPKIYSSFKVNIFSKHFSKAMDSSLWPYGTCVSRFFSKRKDLSMITR